MPSSHSQAAGLATAAEAVAYLRLSRTTLHHLTRRGALTPVRIGRALRFRWSDLRRLAGEGGQP
ncbi:helix-turn-helix domain-containing protein [Thiomonas intermedia]|uniref:helix-turn-helix domain-containing protein n=1 Tax=Thiomonas intermedia TaxID=926 RepID=UPI0009A53D94|nr:helix-turn-helix domain-containing protein [Thiomonas intermedia]